MRPFFMVQATPVSFPGPLISPHAFRVPHSSCRGSSRLTAHGTAGSSAAATTVARLRSLVTPTDRGLLTTPQQLLEIQACVELLAASTRGGGQRGEAGEAGAEAATMTTTTSPSSLSATWRLLWTTERETLFILKNAGLFGTVAGEVYQVRLLAALLTDNQL